MPSWLGPRTRFTSLQPNLGITLERLQPHTVINLRTAKKEFQEQLGCRTVPAPNSPTSG